MVQSIKDLERLLKLCRKQGVTELTAFEISFKLGDLPVRHPEQSIEDQDQIENFPDGMLTPEELTFFANGGNPLENPYRRIDEN